MFLCAKYLAPSGCNKLANLCSLSLHSRSGKAPFNSSLIHNGLVRWEVFLEFINLKEEVHRRMVKYGHACVGRWDPNWLISY